MLIINADLIPMEGEPIPNGYVKTNGGIIEAIGPMTEWSGQEAEETVDAKGAHVLPGFVDAHCHVGILGDGLRQEGDDVNEGSDPCTPHLRGLDAINPDDRPFSEALMAGITTVVSGPGSLNAIGGQLAALKTYGRYIDEMLLQSPVAMKFALGENPKMYYSKKGTPATRMATASIIREQLIKARRYREDRASGKDVSYDPKCEALLPVLAGELRAHFHCHRADDIATAMRIAKEFSLKAVLIHCTEGHKLADVIATEGYPVVIGPLITDRSKPEMRDFRPDNAKILLDAGVQFAICTDHPIVPLQYLPLSAGLTVREGVPALRALAAITIVPAKMVGIAHRVGSIRPGKDADILMFPDDPLSVYAKPSLILAGGRRVR